MRKFDMILSLKKTLALGLVAALLGVMTVYGMSLFVAKRTIASTPVTVSTVWQTWNLSMTLDKTVLEPGENVTITLSLKNIGNSTETYIFPRYVDFDFKVYDTNGTEVFHQWKMVIAPGEGWKVKFVPGQELVRVHAWKPGYVVEGDRYLRGFRIYQGEPIPAGTYTIMGYSDLDAKIATPPVTVVLKP